MTSLIPRSLFLAAGILACSSALEGRAVAQDVTAPETGKTNSPNSTPPQPRPSPVEIFRQLLAMSGAERTEALKIYPEGMRERIVAKLEQYEILPQPMRDLRLQVTELRYYLLPLLQLSPVERESQLKLVPEPCHSMVAGRLQEWDIWPPTLKQDVLEYESTMHYLVGQNAEAPPQMDTNDLSGPELTNLNATLNRWKALPAPQRKQMYTAFKHYFELSDEEQQKTLEALSPPQREETEKVVDPIEKLPKPQQDQYITAFQKFANMTAGERQHFMMNVERWRKMSEPERQAWRDLVKQLAITPPLPPGFTPVTQAAGISVTFPARTNPTASPQR